MITYFILVNGEFMNLPKIRNGSYIINLDEHQSIETHRVALYVNENNVTCFHSFGVGNIPKEI